MTQPNPQKGPKIRYQQAQGSDAVSKDAAGLSSTFEGKLAIAAHGHEQVCDFRTAKQAEEIYQRADKRTRAERTPDGLITLVPVDRIPDKKLKIVITGSCCSCGREVSGKACEVVRFNAEIFQRAQEATGDLSEERWPLADLIIDCDEIIPCVELEVGSRGAQAAFDWLLAHNRAAKAEFKKWVESQPAAADPKADLGSAIAQGVVEALKAMGLAPKAATQAKP